MEAPREVTSARAAAALRGGTLADDAFPVQSKGGMPGMPLVDASLWFRAGDEPPSSRGVFGERNDSRAESAMKLSAIDPKLLLALHALLQEGSVTRAAGRRGIGQPAMSRSLARLREHFKDPLLVRKGRQLVLTPVARALAPSVEKATNAIADVFEDASGPAAETRRIHVVACA